MDGYAASMHEALTWPYRVYEAVGIMNPGGEYNQLATSLLQIENEFYGTIRPKRVIRPGERPLHALRERGVEYVEVRLLDLNPFVPIGITLQNVRFLDIFLLHCLLADSPPDTPAEIAALGRNQHKTAAYGRELPFPGGLQSKFEALAEQSVKDQQAIERSDTLPFEQYRQQYISPERLGLTRAAIAPALAAV